MFKSILVASLLLSSFVSTAIAKIPTEIDPAFQIADVSVTEVQPDMALLDFAPIVPTPDPTPSTTPVTDVIATLDSMIAIGQKIWTIIEAGRPVVTTKLAPSISVIPRITGENPSLNDMSDWSMPAVKSYRVSVKNYFNNEVIGFTYTILFQHSGNYNGVGKYINGLRVQASQINVSWGFSFDASSELVSIANVGSKENPVASAIVQVTYSSKAINREDRQSHSFYVDGKGNIQPL